jgi:NADH-quinone oxidoreductase subunit N
MMAWDVLAALPAVVIASGAVAVLLAVAFARNHVLPFALSVVTLVAAIACLPVAASRAPSQLTTLFVSDGLGLFGTALALVGTLVTALLAFGPLTAAPDERGELSFLLLASCLGACVLVASSSFAGLFLGLELMSVSLFALIAYHRERTSGVEAGIKYLVLAGASSAFLLFGMALVYAQTGSMELGRLAAEVGSGPLVPVGLCMMLVGIGFKLAVVPFHFWTPDVYDGAPAPVSGYIASVSKGAAAIVLLRFLAPAVTGSPTLGWIVAVIAGLSMFAGNLLALREDNVKRILAYSSIAHVGYLLVAFLGRGPEALRAVAFYLAAYVATTLGAFAAVTALSGRERDADSLDDYRGLALRRPAVAAGLTATLLSLAGLPLTAGFVGKFMILTVGGGASLWVLAAMLVVNSTISVFYYFRIVSALFRTPAEAATDERPAVPLLAGVSLAVLSLAVVAAGIYPSPILRLLEIVGG